MGAIASQITSLTIVYSTVYSDADQRKHQSTASLGFVLIMSFFIKKFEHIIFFSVLWPKKLHHCILYVRFRAEFRSNLLPINDSLFFIHLSPLIDTSQSFLITITFSASAIGNFHVSLGNDGLEKTAAEFSGPQARQCGQTRGCQLLGRQWESPVRDPGPVLGRYVYIWRNERDHMIFCEVIVFAGDMNILSASTGCLIRCSQYQPM